ncbi:hypothetical protein PISL3812_06825 [Talaromyces islandicus]|uniref:Uncharacterized protein n=1 Tax=Talaromyces islandicus TaxID=28573 RepID=A0A0U1M433_TALIS|nr:hypothetical protein PISL3812_06825 [Talaromyces islandicus]
MPMQWTAENDNILFLKVLETNNVFVNHSAIAEAWPTEAGKDRPTARAISERIWRLKQKAKQRVSDSVPNTPPDAPATPRTPGGSGSRSRRSGGGGSARVSVKRKKALTPDTDSEVETETPVATKRVKSEAGETAMSELKGLEVSTPSKRSRKPVQYLNMAAWADSDNNGNESEDSFDADFNPDEAPTYCTEKQYHHAIIEGMTDDVDA